MQLLGAARLPIDQDGLGVKVVGVPVFRRLPPETTDPRECRSMTAQHPLYSDPIDSTHCPNACLRVSGYCHTCNTVVGLRRSTDTSWQPGSDAAPLPSVPIADPGDYGYDVRWPTVASARETVWLRRVGPPGGALIVYVATAPMPSALYFVCRSCVVAASKTPTARGELEEGRNEISEYIRTESLWAHSSAEVVNFTCARGTAGANDHSRVSQFCDRD